MNVHLSDTEKQLVERIRELAEAGSQLFSTTATQWVGFNRFDDYYSWQTSSIATLTAALGETGFHTLRFHSLFGQNNPDKREVNSGVGVLKAAADDIEAGVTGNGRWQIAAELFDDQLDIATHLVSDSGLPTLAASLAGAILESGLKELAASNSIEVGRMESIDSVNKKLLKADVISRVRFKVIDTWREIRNNAVHGHADQISESDVTNMITGMREFLAQ